MSCQQCQIKILAQTDCFVLQSDYADDVGSHLYVCRLVTDLMLESWTWLVVNNLTVHLMLESHHTIRLPAPITLLSDFICFLGNTTRRHRQQNFGKCNLIGQSDGDGTLEKCNGSVEINVNDDEWSLPLRNERQTVDLWFPGLLGRQCCHLWLLGAGCAAM